MKIERDESRGQNYIRGSQIFFQNIHMFFEASHKILRLGVVLFVGMIIIFLWLSVPHGDWYFVFKYGLAKMAVSLKSSLSGSKTEIFYHGKYYVTSFGNILKDGFVRQVISTFWSSFIAALVTGLSAFVLLFVFAIQYFRRQGETLSADKFIRGAKLVSNEAYIESCRGIAKSPLYVPAVKVSKRVLKRDYRRAKINRIPIPADFEIQHVLIHGSVGVGKSMLAKHFIDEITKLPTPSKSIIVDVGCNLIPQLYNEETDIILNPFDERSVYWDLWAEFETDIDFANMAASLIPKPLQMNDPFWIDAPRSILASAAYTMQDDPDRSIRKLLDMLMMSDIADLCDFLDKSEARTLVSEKIAKTTLSIRGVMTLYVRCLKFLIGLENNAKGKNGNNGNKAFSIREWVQDDRIRGRLFIAIPEPKRDEMKGLVTLWISRAIDSLLALPEDKARRVYFICDEIGVMNKIEKLQTGMGLGRKNGLSFILGMQSYNQIIKNYGENAARELLDFMNTQFYFKSNEEHTAKFSSANLGEEDVELATLNRSYGGHHRDRQNVSMINQISSRPIVTYTEILNLKNLECYMKASEGLPRTKIHVKPFLADQKCPGLIPRVLDDYQAVDDVLKNMNPDALAHLDGVRVQKIKKEDSRKSDSESAEEFSEDIPSDTDESGNINSQQVLTAKPLSKARGKKGQKIDKPNDLVINENDFFESLGVGE